MKTAFIHADVVTMDPSAPSAGGLLVDGGSVARLLDDVPTGLGKDVRIVDCAGAAIVPGLFDCHVHLTATGLLAGSQDLRDCDSVAAILRRVESSAEPVVYAGKFEEHNLAERRAPLRLELDRAGGDRVVLLSRIDGHSCVVNSAALRALDVSGLDGLELDEAGEPTGRLFAAANYAAQKKCLKLIPNAAKRRADHRAAQMALAAGITTAHNVIEGDAPLEELEAIYRDNAGLPLNIVSKSCTTSVAKAKKLGGRLFGGDIFVDGSIGSRTAALSDRYCDGAGAGLLYLSREHLAELFDEAAESGLSLGVHAIGDRAIDETLAAWETVITRRGPLRTLRPSIDHFEIASEQQIQRAARCGLLLSMQPAFDYLWGGGNGMYAQRLGVERALAMNRLKTALRTGCTLCGGSDSPVTKFDALLGIHASVNHRTEVERLTVEEALRAYTCDAAKLSFDERRRGTLAPDMSADFVLLEYRPDAVPPERIKDIRVLMTVVSGEVRYRAA